MMQMVITSAEKEEVMKKLLMCVVSAAVCLWGLSSAQSASYEHEVEAKGVTFAWTVDGATLHGKLFAKTEGWVGVGFNPSNKMKDANFILGYVKDGEATVVDHFGDKSTGHSADEKLGGSSDVTLVGGSEDNKMTTIEFTIPLDSGDQYDSVLNADGDTVLLLAYGPDRDSFKPRHRNRALITVNLSSGEVK
jgi:opacity protein-like surface antigen